MTFTEEDKKIMATLNSFEVDWYKKIRETGLSSEEAQLLALMKASVERDKHLIKCIKEAPSWGDIKMLVASRFKK